MELAAESEGSIYETIFSIAIELTELSEPSSDRTLDDIQKRLNAVIESFDRQSNASTISDEEESEEAEEEKTGRFEIDEVQVWFTPGYTNWDGWHINWALGETKSGEEVYHVTREGSPKIHYFFTLNAGKIKDAVAPKRMKGQGGTSAKFSELPSKQKDFIEKNINMLMHR